jgi:L-ascorbate metabolism protein UlaG (beta-lactamase superfamily)
MPSKVAAITAAALLSLPLAAAPQGKGKTEITWYGHAAFVIRTPGGTVLAIDPWLSNPRAPQQGLADKLPKIDFILLTHGHFDHVGDAVAIAKRTGAKLVTSFDLGQALIAAGYPKEQAGFDTLGNVGGSIQAGDATVALVAAIHSSAFQADEKSAPIPAGSPMGFVIQVKGGPTLYHTGDTDVTSDMRQIPERYGPVDAMLACIGGHFTMDPRGAALAASYVKAKVVVPMHYGTFPVLTGTPKDLEAALKGRAKVMTLEPGKPANF